MFYLAQKQSMYMFRIFQYSLFTIDQARGSINLSGRKFSVFTMYAALYLVMFY